MFRALSKVYPPHSGLPLELQWLGEKACAPIVSGHHGGNDTQQPKQRSDKLCYLNDSPICFIIIRTQYEIIVYPLSVTMRNGMVCVEFS